MQGYSVSVRFDMPINSENKKEVEEASKEVIKLWRACSRAPKSVRPTSIVVPFYNPDGTVIYTGGGIKKLLEAFKVRRRSSLYEVERRERREMNEQWEKDRKEEEGCGHTYKGMPLR